MKESRYTSSDEGTGLLFWQVSALWQRSVKESLYRFDLTLTQYVLLAVIAELNEVNTEVTQKQISDVSMIDPMTISSTLRLLERKGLVQRNQSKSDSRANTICNTLKGLSLLGEAVKAAENVDSDFFFRTDKEAEVFRMMLNKLKTKNQKVRKIHVKVKSGC